MFMPKAQFDKSFILKGMAVFEIKNGPVEWYTCQVKKQVHPKYGTKFFLSVREGIGFKQWTYVGVVSTKEGSVRLTRASPHHDQSRVVQTIRRAMAYVWNDLELPDGFEINISKQEPKTIKMSLPQALCQIKLASSMKVARGFITKGTVRVNGEAIKDSGHVVKSGDKIKVGSKRMKTLEYGESDEKCNSETVNSGQSGSDRR
jgi:ribosome-associated protein YbcJ (S4-like RNA binding protein)